MTLPGFKLSAASRRVALGFAQRMASPAVTLMHNGSSFHALPALLSDLHGALAGVANGTDPKTGAIDVVVKQKGNMVTAMTRRVACTAQQHNVHEPGHDCERGQGSRCICRCIWSDIHFADDPAGLHCSAAAG